MYSIKILSRGETEKFRLFLGSFTPEPDGKNLCAGASLLGIPIGAAAGTFILPGHFRIFRFHVIEKYRRNGVGKLLFNTLLSSLAEKCASISVRYTTDLSNRRAADFFFDSMGFLEPETVNCIYRGTYSRVIKEKWLFRPKLGNYTFQLFSDVLTEEIENLARHPEASEWEKLRIAPYGEIARGYEKINSLVLRDADGTIAGWTITHRMTETMIRYSCLYTMLGTRHRALAVPMLLESFRLAHEKGITEATWCVSMGNRRMYEFTEKHLRGSAIYRKEEVERHLHIH